MRIIRIRIWYLTLVLPTAEFLFIEHIYYLICFSSIVLHLLLASVFNLIYDSSSVLYEWYRCLVIISHCSLIQGESRSVLEILRDLPTLLRHLFLRLVSGGEQVG